VTEQVDVLIIGAGFSGLCVARGLAKRKGFTFKLLERGDDVGGTWRDNTYPGCACDIPSPLYSFSFAQNTKWTRLFARQPEILDYLRDFARRHGLLEHIRFGEHVDGAQWDESSRTWSVTTTGGQTYTCRFLVSAIGALHVPSIPDLAGIERFQGDTMHSAEWDHELDLKGKRVAVIGTGASAIQFVPEIVGEVEHLTLFQRTPSWIVPKSDRPFTDSQRRLRGFSPYRWYARERLFWIHESRRKGFTGSDTGMADTERLARSLLKRQVADPELRAKLTPDYAIGCKRLLISSNYYPAVSRDNVTVETSSVREVHAHSVVTGDGNEHPVDVLIYGTGFDTQHGLASVPVVGRDGVKLADRWDGGMEAYLGTTVSGFPNYFVMMGPNSGLGHNSQVFMIEAQARYVLSCLRRMRRRRVRAIEVKVEVERRFNGWLQGALAGSVWQTGGCRSWYQHAKSGRNTLLWPSSTVNFWWRTRRMRFGDYVRS
jgi:cation diffusion facilitator CzcD-associated flavoprotein CzcO